MTNTNNTTTIQASREGLVNYLSGGERTLHSTSQVLSTAGYIEDAIISEVLSTYLGLLALTVNSGMSDVLIDQSLLLMTAYSKASGEEGAEEELIAMDKALDGFKEAIAKERNKPVPVAGTATVH